MNTTNRVALAALQVIASSGGLVQATHQKELTDVPGAKTQDVINQLSLASIEKSWLAIPRMCKAVSFYAQPIAIANSQRSVAITSLYSTLLG